ncbi:MAG: hypothetical protein ACLFSQ_03120 [Candidatus Zixiibacteriota bacterium]
MNKYILFFVLILFIAISFSEPVMSWWVNDCGGFVSLRGDSVNGASAGQNAVINTFGISTRSIATLGYWVEPLIPYIDINLPSYVWDIGEIDIENTIAMSDGDEFHIQNRSNTPVSLGLSYDHSEPDGWTVDVFTSYEKCIIHCWFTNATAPLSSEYHPANDILTNEIIWADDTKYGPAGDFVDFGSSVKLFMKFVAPHRTASFDTLEILHIDLLVRTNLP